MHHSKEFIKIVQDTLPHIKEISPEDVKKLIDNDENFILLDVREKNEWDQGALPKAEHLSKGVIERDIVSVISNKNQKIILYCGGGYRSTLAAYSIQKMGYNNIYSMSGGYRQWNELNYPIKHPK